MKNLTKTILALLAAGLVTTALSTHEAQAARINGTIDFAGAVHFDSSHLDAVNQVLTWRDVNGNLGFSNVAAFTGDFGGFVTLGQQATMATPWTFIPSTDTPGLWSVGGFSFHLLSSIVVTRDAEFLNIKGSGIVSGNGFDPTNANWAFSVQDAGGTHDFFSFSANVATVPDGGSAVALLGISLGAIEFIRRKLRLRVTGLV
jgi:protein with PEP-CTERM/exosortase system signal